MRNYFIVFLFLLISVAVKAQLNITSGTRINIGTGATIAVTGNITALAGFSGTGILALKGTSLQQLSMNGYSIPKLQISNVANVSLNSDARISQSLIFSSGKIRTGAYRLIIENAATITGAGAGKFVETNGSGSLRKIITANLANYNMPVGNGSNYTPVSVTTSGTYSSAYVSVSSKGAIHPNKPSAVANYLNTYWNVSRTGVSGTVNATATYVPANVVGNESLLRAYVRNGSTWSVTGASINISSNTVTAPISGTGSDVYAMSTIPAGSASVIDDLGLENTRRNSSMVLFPNPTRGNAVIAMNINADQSVKIIVLDITGRIIQMKNTKMSRGYNQHQLDLNGLSNGVYKVHVQSIEGSKIFRVIKQP